MNVINNTEELRQTFTYWAKEIHRVYSQNSAETLDVVLKVNDMDGEGEFEGEEAASATAADTDAVPPTIIICLQPLAAMAVAVEAVKVPGSVNKTGIFWFAAKGPTAKPSAYPWPETKKQLVIELTVPKVARVLTFAATALAVA